MRFNEKKFAEDYDMRLAEEGYPGELLTIVTEELKGTSSVIDVGAGTGFFAIPLARSGFKVTAVEPSEEMVKIFREKIAAENLSVNIFTEKWESADVGPADSLISVHSIYPMADPRYSIFKMKRAAERCLMIVRKKSTGPSISDEIRSAFKKNKCSQIVDTDIMRMLDASGIQYTIRDLIQSRKSKFNNLDEEASYYIDHLGLGQEAKDEIMDIIKRHTDNNVNVNGYSYTTIYNDTMLIF